MKSRKNALLFVLALFAGIFSSCKDEMNTPLDPDKAEIVSIDRFSSNFAHLFVRTSTNGFPAANVAIDFDAIPALNTFGLGPNGEKTHYYNFDVLSTTPAPIYRFFRDGETNPVSGQLNVIDVIPGDEGYNDFWQVVKVTVPKDYVANTITSYDGVMKSGYAMTATTTIVNCPVVPKGSVAKKRFLSTESSELTRGWYKNKVVFYFNFFEKILTAIDGKVPTSDIYVTFNINPGQNGGGPASGFKTENGTSTGQTHNVPQTIPTDDTYSPLWDVQIYDNTNFSSVSNLTSAINATLLAADAAVVNCPIVEVTK